MKMDTYDQNLRYDYEAPASLKLLFSTAKVNSPVFTGQTIIGKSGDDGGITPIKVMLVDSNTQETITTGPLAFAKVRIVLLRGDYGGSTAREFKANIVVDWKNKKNILQGGPCFDLKHGCATINRIKIKHDRNPIKKVKFRLGAMVVDCPYIEEAVTDTFEVKDLRNLPKTIRRLSLEDNVGRLKNIGSKRAGMIRARLKREKIHTVREFLQRHSSNPKELQKICGMKGKKWEMALNHAKTSLKGKVRVESTSQEPNTLAYGSFVFDNNGYRPQPCEDEHIMSISMIRCPSLSINDFEVWYPSCEPAGQASQEGRLNGVKAKKRWMILRVVMAFNSLRKLG